MRIVQILLSERIGGAESLVVALTEEMRRSGHDVTVIYLDDSGHKKGTLARVSRLRKEIRRLQPDVIVSHTLFPNLFSRAASRRPCIMVLHSSGDDYQNFLCRLAERALAGSAASVVAVSPTAAEVFTRRFPRRSIAAVIPNGIRSDLPELDNGTQQRRAPWKFVTVARFATEKEPGFWFATTQNFCQTGDFSWVGPIVPDSSALSVASKVQNVPNANLLGPSTDVGNVLTTYDIMFHPAAREAQGISLLEAAAVGVPVVCSSTVAANFNFRLAFATFAPGDVDAATAALQFTATRFEEAQAHARGIRPLVRERFSIESVSDQYLALARAGRRQLRRK